MRIVADNEDEYKEISLLQKLFSANYKIEKANGGSDKLIAALKSFINTPIEKTYVQPGQSTAIANTSTMDTEDPKLMLAYIVHAAINRKKLAIEYTSAGKPTSKRLIEPMNWKGDNLVAWCHEAGAWRHFKLASMTRVAVTDEEFDRSEDVTIVANDVKDMAHIL